MNLTYVCGFAWEPKGTVRARAFPLAEEMVRRGHDVTLIIAPYDNLADSGREFEANGVQVVNLKIANGAPATLAKVPGDLVRTIQRSNPDLVHVFKPKGFAGMAASWLLLKNQRPVIIDCDDWEGWGGWNELKDYPWAMKEFIDLQERWLIRKAAAVTVASNALRDRAAELRMNPREIYYLPNGPTSKQLELSERMLRGSAADYKKRLGFSEIPTVLYAGHFDPADDVMFFCRAMAKVAAKHAISIAFAGNGPELGKVRSFAADHPQLKARFFEGMRYENYAELVCAADVCAFPYPDTQVYRAKCSARIIDYMLYAKPIVSTSVGQNAEYIINENSGLLTRAGDQIEFEQALARLIEDAALRQRLGANARARLLERFLWRGAAGDTCENAYRIGVIENFSSLSLAS